MARRRKTKRVYLPATISMRRGRLNDVLGFMKMRQFEPSLYGAITGVAAAFVDNVLNIDPKIKGLAMVIGSAFIPADDSVKGAIAGKGGELLARSFGIISDTISDGFVVISENELNEIAEAISDELTDNDIINDNEIISDAIYEEIISDEVINDETQI